MRSLRVIPSLLLLLLILASGVICTCPNNRFVVTNIRYFGYAEHLLNICKTIYMANNLDYNVDSIVTPPEYSVAIGCAHFNMGKYFVLRNPAKQLCVYNLTDTVPAAVVDFTDQYPAFIGDTVVERADFCYYPSEGILDPPPLVVLNHDLTMEGYTQEIQNFIISENAQGRSTPIFGLPFINELGFTEADIKAIMSKLVIQSAYVNEGNRILNKFFPNLGNGELFIYIHAGPIDRKCYHTRNIDQRRCRVTPYMVDDTATERGWLYPNLILPEMYIFRTGKLENCFKSNRRVNSIFRLANPKTYDGTFLEYDRVTVEVWIAIQAPFFYGNIVSEWSRMIVRFREIFGKPASTSYLA